MLLLVSIPTYFTDALNKSVISYICEVLLNSTFCDSYTAYWNIISWFVSGVWTSKRRLICIWIYSLFDVHHVYLLQATHTTRRVSRRPCSEIHFPSDAATCCAACATIIVPKMDGNSPHYDYVQPSDTTVKAPEFDLFLALLIVTAAERLVQVPSHLTATEAEPLVKFPSLLTARGRNTGLVSFSALRQQRRSIGPFSLPSDSNGGRITGTVSFPPKGNGGRTTGPVSFPPDGNRDELLVQFPSHLTATAPEL